MFKQKLFGSRITPACGYCEHGSPAQDGISVLCLRNGLVTTDYSCRKFAYDPLCRVPRVQPPLTPFDKSDFEL